MKYLVWLLRAAFFFLLFAFSMNNQQPVTVHWFFGMKWQGPMVLAMLVAFTLGLVLGLLTVLPSWRRYRNREQGFSATFQPSTYAGTLEPKDRD